MPARSILWPDPRVQPPFGSAEVDWSHPLARGLGAFWLLNERVGTRLTNLVTPHDFILTTPMWGAVGLQADGVNSSTPAKTPVIPQLNSQAAVSAVTRIRATVASTTFSRIIEKGDNSEWAIALDSGGDRLTMQRGTGFACISNTSITDGKWKHVVGLADATSTRMHLDTVLQSATDSAFIGGTGGFTFLNYGGAVGYEFLGAVEFLSIYTRALTPSEVNWLYGEPYAMLRPIRQRRYFVPAVSAASLVFRSNPSIHMLVR